MFWVSVYCHRFGWGGCVYVFFSFFCLYSTRVHVGVGIGSVNVQCMCVFTVCSCVIMPQSGHMSLLCTGPLWTP